MKALICLLIVFCVIGCRNERAPEKQPGKNFLFYPLPNVYFDEDNREYYYFDSSGNSWRASAHLPSSVDPSLGKSIKLTNLASPVYQKNDEHRLIHGTVLYSSPEELKRQYKEDSMATLAPPKDTVQSNEEVKKKNSKFGDWLRKVFRKKD